MLESVDSYRSALNQISSLAKHYLEQSHIITDAITVKLAFKLLDGFYKTLDKECKMIHREWISPQFFETPRGQ